MATIKPDTYRKQGDKSVIDKDPNAQLDYTFDWTEWLDVVQDIIASVEFITSEDLTVVDTDTDATGKIAKVIVSGGNFGTEAAPLSFITCRITTANAPPLIEDRTIWLKIKQR